MTPLVVIDPVELWTIEFFLDQCFYISRWNPLNRRELFRRPGLWILSLSRLRRLTARTTRTERKPQQQSR
jgi:hypothetical protein